MAFLFSYSEGHVMSRSWRSLPSSGQGHVKVVDVIAVSCYVKVMKVIAIYCHVKVLEVIAIVCHIQVMSRS